VDTRVLVVDDDARIVTLICAYLRREGCAVTSAGDGRTAVRLIRSERPRVVVLDVMLPELDGFGVLAEIGRRDDMAVLLLTARSGVGDRVRGLRGGADDYLVKPFDPRELVARVQALDRRLPGPARRLVHDDLVIDLERHEVRIGGRRVDLTSLEFQLLVSLAGAGGRVLTRDRLLDELSADPAADVLERSVDVYVRRLRAKLDDDARRPRYVETVRGVGYRMA
jgi:DNA-binding response OmpR family regulator